MGYFNVDDDPMEVGLQIGVLGEEVLVDVIVGDAERIGIGLVRRRPGNLDHRVRPVRVHIEALLTRIQFGLGGASSLMVGTLVLDGLPCSCSGCSCKPSQTEPSCFSRVSMQDSTDGFNRALASPLADGGLYLPDHPLPAQIPPVRRTSRCGQ